MGTGDVVKVKVTGLVDRDTGREPGAYEPARSLIGRRRRTRGSIGRGRSHASGIDGRNAGAETEKSPPPGDFRGNRRGRACPRTGGSAKRAPIRESRTPLPDGVRSPLTTIPFPRRGGGGGGGRRRRGHRPRRRTAGRRPLTLFERLPSMATMKPTPHASFSSCGSYRPSFSGPVHGSRCAVCCTAMSGARGAWNNKRHGRQKPSGTEGTDGKNDDDVVAKYLGGNWTRRGRTPYGGHVRFDDRRRGTGVGGGSSINRPARRRESSRGGWDRALIERVKRDVTVDDVWHSATKYYYYYTTATTTTTTTTTDKIYYGRRRKKRYSRVFIIRLFL